MIYVLYISIYIYTYTTMTDITYDLIDELNYCIGINNIYNNLSVEKL